MNLAFNAVINTYSILLMIIIYHQLRRLATKETLQYRLYIMMLQITGLLLVLDVFSRFDGNPGTLYPMINHVGNFLVFLLSPVLPSIWLIYVCWQVCHDSSKLKLLRFPLIAIFTVNAGLTILSLFHGWYYTIDAGNIYHRGPLFILAASFSIVLILVAFIVTLVNRKKIDKRLFFSLIFFAVPPFICVLLQTTYYGISLMLNSMVLSMLIVFLNIQNQDMHTDYLTGVNNRKKLETYLKRKIKACTDGQTFSAILLDLDDFKAINDSFGHDMGDDVLGTSARLLKDCIRTEDFIARYGGDEFFIILNVSDQANLEAAVSRIKKYIKMHNESGDLPLKIEFSMGYAVYDQHARLDVEAFEKLLDVLMYKDKRVNKEMEQNRNTAH